MSFTQWHLNCITGSGGPGPEGPELPRARGFQQATQFSGLPVQQDTDDAGPQTPDDSKQLLPPPLCKFSPKC